MLLTGYAGLGDQLHCAGLTLLQQRLPMDADARWSRLAALLHLGAASGR
ncbi:hypothetical protein CCHOA_10305 [Corynebacterium choanae]|uniref:Uncharacterized protein n=1 Tax=Corynebacterium choanae TaxID=1862358 RepID=A0A3G6JE76_9CORY|nr:hypothetical protein CCHOA_10305 [Corynebacterium choanae]